MMAPTLDQLCTELQGSVKFVKLDIYANRKIAFQHKIQAAPTFFVYRNGQLLAESRGAQNKRQFNNWIQSALAG